MFTITDKEKTCGSENRKRRREETVETASASKKPAVAIECQTSQTSGTATTANTLPIPLDQIKTEPIPTIPGYTSIPFEPGIIVYRCDTCMYLDTEDEILNHPCKYLTNEEKAFHLNSPFTIEIWREALRQYELQEKQKASLNAIRSPSPPLLSKDPSPEVPIIDPEAGPTIILSKSTNNSIATNLTSPLKHGLDTSTNQRRQKSKAKQSKYTLEPLNEQQVLVTLTQQCSEADPKNRSNADLNSRSGGERSAKAYFCELCSMSFGRKKGLEGHIAKSLNHQKLAKLQKQKPPSIQIHTEEQIQDEVVGTQAKASTSASSTTKSKAKKQGKGCINVPKEATDQALGSPPNTKQCEHCQENFPFSRQRDKKLFQEHLEIHYGQREFVCPICYRGFKTGIFLLTHAASHGDGPDQYRYDCPTCPDKFKYKKDLQAHLKSCKPKEQNGPKDESTPEPNAKWF